MPKFEGKPLDSETVNYLESKAIYFFDTSCIPIASWWQRYLNKILPRRIRFKDAVVKSATLTICPKDGESPSGAEEK